MRKYPLWMELAPMFVLGFTVAKLGWFSLLLVLASVIVFWIVTGENSYLEGYTDGLEANSDSR